MRTLVDIPETELDALNAVSKAEGVSRAESIRRAIKAYVELKAPSSGVEDGFGLWKDYDIDGDEYQRRVRAEWDREWNPKLNTPESGPGLPIHTSAPSERDK